MEVMNTYKVTPKLKKCTYSTELWDNLICNKKVILEKTTVWRYGEFNITIYEKEKEELLKKENININDYYGEFIYTNQFMRILMKKYCLKNQY